MTRIDRKPNQLIHEKSPYLLQHAYNPVNWHPWGEEALAKAAAEDKLIFLSIGYATCHWCHVMAHESFEDETTAGILNDHFISIKVDREERPDLDAIYMDALHAMGQQGGWPLNIFITPGQEPIFGGTYFPPTPRYGLRSFQDILLAVSAAWRNNRAQLLETSGTLRKFLTDAQAPRIDAGLPDEGCFTRAYQTYRTLFDSENYGFKTDAKNKFPPSMALSFLMNYARHSGQAEANDMVERTLVAMKRGGIYDQLGGGLCRYSTDPRWLVPHFEKMLYDNALFLQALAAFYQISGQEFFRQAAYDVIRYIQRDLTVQGGGIASAEDADSEGEEGRFYLWTAAEFREVTGTAADFLASFWKVTEKGVMQGRNILHEDIHALPLTPEEAYPPEQAAIIKTCRKKLLQKRSERPRPLRDDKVLTAWNSLTIRSLVKAGQAFDDPGLVRGAAVVHDFIFKQLFTANGRLLRRYRNGQSGIPGYLADYAELGLASFELFKATSEIVYLEKAQHLADEAIRLFQSDFGPFYETGQDVTKLLRRTINGTDGVEPAGNSSLARLLIYLSALDIGEQKYHQFAEGIFRYFKNELEQYPVSCPAMLEAYLAFTHPPAKIMLAGERDNRELQQSMAYLNRIYRADDLIFYVPPELLADSRFLMPIPPGNTQPAGFSASICWKMTCYPPVHSYQELKTLTDGLDKQRYE